MNALTMRNYVVDELAVNLEQLELEEALQELDAAIQSHEQWYAELNKVLYLIFLLIRVIYLEILIIYVLLVRG